MIAALLISSTAFSVLIGIALFLTSLSPLLLLALLWRDRRNQKLW